MHLALSAPAHHLAELRTTQGDFGVGQSLDKSWTNLPVRSRCSARVKRRNLFRSRGQIRSQNRLAGSTFDLSNKRSIPVVTVLFLMKAPLEASRETLQNALDDVSWLDFFFFFVFRRGLKMTYVPLRSSRHLARLPR